MSPIRFWGPSPPAAGEGGYFIAEPPTFNIKNNAVPTGKVCRKVRAMANSIEYAKTSFRPFILDSIIMKVEFWS